MLSVKCTDLQGGREVSEFVCADVAVITVSFTATLRTYIEVSAFKTCPGSGDKVSMGCGGVRGDQHRLKPCPFLALLSSENIVNFIPSYSEE